MGLNDTYGLVKSNILMMSPLPSVNYDYALLMQYKKYREVYVNSQYPGDPASFLAANHNNSFSQKFGNYEAKGRKNNMICSNCKNPGHSVDKCYRIIGFPTDLKFTKVKIF